MSVKRELERWAAAQMANVTDPAQLARYIRRILRGVDTYKLEALGGAGFSGEQREARPGDKETTDIPGPVFALDSGLLVSSADPSYPLTIYCGTELAAYFASTGTEIIGRLVGGNPVYEFLVGVAEASETICSGAYAIPDWTDTAPTLDADDGYDSAVWTSGALSAEPQSSLYSGLMRLGVQCKIGARKAAEDLCGFTALNAAAHGLMLDKQTYTFWSVQINSSGAAAKKLQNSENSECIREQLAAGDIAEISDDYIRYLAWLISDLTPSTESEVALLTSAQVADVYSNGKAPIAHGWKYSRFSNKASIATYRETTSSSIPCGESGLWTVSVTFSGAGVPSASISQDTANTLFRINPAYHCLWYPALGKHHILRQALSSDPNQYTTFAGAVAPIYCWYDRFDDLQTITYQQYATTAKTSLWGQNNGSVKCCAGSDGWYQQITGYVNGATHTGGYINSAHAIGGATQQYTCANAQEITYTWQLGADTGRINYSTSGWQKVNDIATRWGFPATNCTDTYQDILSWSNGVLGTDLVGYSEYSHIYGTGTAQRDTITGGRTGFANIQVIPQNDAEAVYSVVLEQWSNYSLAHAEWINEGALGGDTYGNDPVWLQEYITLQKTGEDLAYYPKNNPYHGIGWGPGVGALPCTAGICQQIISVGASSSASSSDSGTGYTVARGYLVSAPDIKLPISNIYADWDYYIWSGVAGDELDQKVDSWISYLGSSIHAVDDSTTMTLEGGYGLDHSELPAYQRWIGFV